MKINLNEYKNYLKEIKNLSDQTIETYASRLKYYQKNNKDLDGKSKNYINQTKQAVKYALMMNDIYYNSETINLTKLHNSMKHKKPENTKLKLSTINKKINALKDKRKKLAYRLQEVSGLRLSEIANLKKNDIEFTIDEKIFVLVQKGKCGKARRVATIKDKYLYKELQLLEERKGRLFYKAITLRKKAWELHFKTHKLRKVTAKYLNIKYEAKNEADRREFIQKILGHEVSKKNRCYKRYTDENDTEIDVRNTRFDI
jgi:integrase